MRAVVDIGTNSVRLLVAQIEAGEIKPLIRHTIITRLGRGVDKAGLLQPEAVKRTLEALAEIAQLVPAGVPVDVLATSAVRDATNRGEFKDLVYKRTGWKLQVLSGQVEAKLSLRGAVSAVKNKIPPGPVSVVDVGGGSTEIYTGDVAGRMYGGGSTQLGAVRMLERFITQHPLLAKEKASLEQATEQLLAPLVEENLQFNPASLIVVGGTATTLAAIALALPEFNYEKVNGLNLSLEKLWCQYEKLGKLSLDERRLIPGLQVGREDIIVSGTCILGKAVQLMGFASFAISVGDLLYGWLHFSIDEW